MLPHFSSYAVFGQTFGTGGGGASTPALTVFEEAVPASKKLVDIIIRLLLPFFATLELQGHCYKCSGKFSVTT